MSAHLLFWNCFKIVRPLGGVIGPLNLFAKIQVSDLEPHIE
jgi:uncharacterized membrane-anchored protein